MISRVTALAETDVAPQLAVVARVQSTQHFTSRQATATAALPAHFFTGAITPTQVFFLSYTPVITPTAPAQTPPGTLAFANFTFELLAYLDDHPQHGAFALPITLMIGYDPAILGQIDPTTLGLLFFGTAVARAPEGITVVSHDVAGGVLTVTLSYLGDFALFGGRAHPHRPRPGAGARHAHPRLYLPVVMSEASGVTSHASPVTSQEATVTPDELRATHDASPTLYPPAVNR